MSTAPQNDLYDCIVIGGGPSGATAAHELALKGRSIALLDKAGRIKPCGGAIPPRCVKDYQIPDSMLCAKVDAARMISPSDNKVNMPIGNLSDGTKGYVGMVNRETFDEWLRARAADAGAERHTGTFKAIRYAADGTVEVDYLPKGEKDLTLAITLRGTSVIGADGANSEVKKQALPDVPPAPKVFAYHEIVKAPQTDSDGYEAKRCDVYYQGKLSPDFYAWVFPHGDTASIGVGSANKGFSLRNAVAELRDDAGLAELEMVRHEGAPIPMKPLKRWHDKRAVLLAGDAAGVVAPSSGEGIYYAMVGGSEAATSIDAFLVTGQASELAQARKRFLKSHGRVFWILGMMQFFWYSSDKRRERFVTMCEDADVQRLTWESYMNKKLDRKDPLAHVKIFFKDTAHLLGLGKARA